MLRMAQHNPLIFVSESLEDRLDCEYYHPKYKEFYKIFDSSKYVIKDIGDKDVAYITDGDHSNPIYVENGILYLRAVNITSEGIDLENDIRYIPEIQNKKILKSELKPHDVLLVIVGATIGKTALVPEHLERANISRDVARIAVTKDINPRYILFYLDSKLGQMQIKRQTTGSAQGGLYLKSIKELKVILPSREVQDKITDSIQGYKDLAKENIREYRSRLSDIKKILQENLNVELKEKNTRTFATRPEDLKDRLDNFSCSPNYELLMATLKKAEEKGYCKLMKGNELKVQEIQMEEGEVKIKTFKYVDLGNTEKDFGKIIGFQEDFLFNLPTRARQMIYGNDILLPRPIGSTEGIVIVPKEFDKQLCSTGFIQIRPETSDEAILLWTILKSNLVQKQFFYLQSGSLQPEITPKNFKENIMIPMPNEDIKKKIVDEVKQKTEEAIEFKKKYVDSEEKAQQVFIEMLLNS